LQLHLPGAHPHPVRGRLPRQALSRPGERDVRDPFRRTTDRPDGHPGRSRATRLVSLFRRGRLRDRTGVCDRWRRNSVMKLVRFGSPGQERPGVLLEDGTQIDVSEFGGDYDEAFFAGDGLRALSAWLSGNAADAPRTPTHVRLGPPIVRPSKIVCIGLNFRDHAAESNMAIPQEPVLFFKSTTA